MWQVQKVHSTLGRINLRFKELELCLKFKELIEKNYDELTKLIVSEHGKVYEDAKGSLTSRS